MEHRIRVLLVEDDPLAQRAVEAYLSRAKDMELVGIASDGEAAIPAAHELRPDVAIVDIHLPRLSGIEVTAKLTAPPLNCKVACFTALGDDRTLMQALQSGASGFLLKTDTPGLLIHGVRSAYNGDALISPKLVATLLRSSTTHHSEPPATLTNSDKKLLGLIGAGLSNLEIATTLHLAPSTIKTYVSRLLTKLNRPNRAALAALAYEWRLITE